MKNNWIFCAMLGIICVLLLYVYLHNDDEECLLKKNELLKNFANGCTRGILAGTAMGGIEFGIISGVMGGFINGIMVII